MPVLIMVEVIGIIREHQSYGKCERKQSCFKDSYKLARHYSNAKNTRCFLEIF